MFKSRDVVLVSWNTVPVVRVMRTCIFTLRKLIVVVLLVNFTDILLVAQIQMRYKKPKSFARIFSRMSENNMKNSRLVHLNNVATAKAPVIRESEAMVIAPQTDLTRMAVDTKIITIHQLLTLLTQAVPQPLQTITLQMLPNFMPLLLILMPLLLILMLHMVGMTHMSNTISSIWQPWLNINNSSRVLLARVLLHLQARLHPHHLADRYV